VQTYINRQNFRLKWNKFEVIHLIGSETSGIAILSNINKEDKAIPLD